MIAYLKVGLDPILLRVTSEPYVVATSRGYAPVINVIDCKSEKESVLFISARSIAEKLEPMRKANKNLFTGLEFWISKESTDKMAQYILDQP